MDEKVIQGILIDVIYATVNELDDNTLTSIKQKITPENLPFIYRLAKKHDLAHVVSNFVRRAKIELDQKVQTLLQQEELASIYRHEQMKYAFGEICSAFDEAKITYVPLKGSVIRPYYPYENMRTSCDIDILIHEEDLDIAIKELCKKDYQCGKREYHDVSLYSPNKIHLELHFNVQENQDNLDAVLKDVWQYTTQKDGYKCEFSKEFFAFHIFAHMAYHFVGGGCGIRSLLDVWIMEHKMGISYSCAKDLLTKAGIYQFAVKMSELSELCFTTNQRDDFFDCVLKYIFQGGVYGSRENHVAVSKNQAGSSAAYVLKRLFLPYKTMVLLYPVLKKAPILLPFCWVARIFNAIFAGKSKRIVSEVKCATNTSSEKLNEIEDIYSRLGL